MPNADIFADVLYGWPHTQTKTDTHTRPIALPGILKWTAAGGLRVSKKSHTRRGIHE